MSAALLWSPAVWGLLLGLALLLVAEGLALRPLVWISKPLASLCFVLVALGAGATESPYGIGILVGLVLCLIGDCLLIPHAKLSFLGGLAAFLAGHVAYAVSFAGAGARPLLVLIALLLLLPLRLGVLHWLLPKVETSMRLPVQAYAAVITLMLGFALASCSFEGASTTRDFLVAAGASLFYLSDLSVARDRFVAPGFINRAWGLPAYYLGQLLLALSVAAA